MKRSIYISHILIALLTIVCIVQNSIRYAHMDTLDRDKFTVFGVLFISSYIFIANMIVFYRSIASTHIQTIDDDASSVSTVSIHSCDGMNIFEMVDPNESQHNTL